MNRRAARWFKDAGVAAALTAALASVHLVDRLRPPAVGQGATAQTTAVRPATGLTLAFTPVPAPDAVPAEAKRDPALPAKPVVVAGTAVVAPAVGVKAVPPPDSEVKLPLGVGTLKSIYQARTAENRNEWIGNLGGSHQSEQSVDAGLDWLARHQVQSGAWCNRYVGDGPESVCEHGRRCAGPGRDFIFAQSGLALLALQAGGHYAFNGKKYSGHVKRGLDCLVTHQGGNGGLYALADVLEPRKGRPTKKARPGLGGAMSFGDDIWEMRSPMAMYEHGIATFALAEACAVAVASNEPPDPKYVAAMKEAVALIERAQRPDGGWRYTPIPRGASDTSVTGWQVLALKSAREAGVTVPATCMERVRAYFRSCETGSDGQTSYMSRGGGASYAMTGVGMLAHEFLLDDSRCDLVRKGAAYLAREADAAGRAPSYYDLYNCTFALYAADGPSGPHWTQWNRAVRDRLIAMQRPADAGCERGSWPMTAHDHEDKAGGRVYTTALAVLTLEVYYRFATGKK
jgi:hypothetical protein